MIDIHGIDKKKIFAALYNNARPVGMGLVHHVPGPLSDGEIEQLFRSCEEDLYFDYVKGRSMKINLNNDFLDSYLYDRDNGEDAAKLALINAGLMG